MQAGKSRADDLWPLRCACVVFLTLSPIAASANPLNGNVLRENGAGWWAVLTLGIALIEWPVLAAISGMRWPFALVAVLVANVASGLVGPPWQRPARILEGYGLELLIVAVVALLSRPSRKPWYSLLVAFVAMNLASCWVVPTFATKLPLMGETMSACASNQRRIYFALSAYCEDHEELLPPVSSATELRDLLYPRLSDDDRYLFCCPATGGRWSLYGPHSSDIVNYVLRVPLATKMPHEGEPSAFSRAFLADDRPRHRLGKGRMYLYYDGHVRYCPEDKAPPS